MINGKVANCLDEVLLNEDIGGFVGMFLFDSVDDIKDNNVHPANTSPLTRPHLNHTCHLPTRHQSFQTPLHKEQITELPILPRDKAAELPLSFAQTRLWFLAEFESNSSFYNIPLALRLEGNLNSEILIQSLEEICDRHEALRTNFITVDGIPTQVIQTRTWTVTVVDLQHLSGSEQAIASQELAQNQAIQPFDLAGEPLIRTTLVVLSETEHLLLVCMHHIVSDGWSMGVFIQ